MSSSAGEQLTLQVNGTSLLHVRFGKQLHLAPPWGVFCFQVVYGENKEVVVQVPAEFTIDRAKVSPSLFCFLFSFSLSFPINYFYFAKRKMKTSKFSITFLFFEIVVFKFWYINNNDNGLTSVERRKRSWQRCPNSQQRSRPSTIWLSPYARDPLGLLNRKLIKPSCTRGLC